MPVESDSAGGTYEKGSVVSISNGQMSHCRSGRRPSSPPEVNCARFGREGRSQDEF